MAGRREERHLRRTLSLVWRDGDWEKQPSTLPGYREPPCQVPELIIPLGGGRGSRRAPKGGKACFRPTQETSLPAPGTAGPRRADAGSGLIPRSSPSSRSRQCLVEGTVLARASGRIRIKAARMGPACRPHPELLSTARKPSVVPCGSQWQFTILGWGEEAKGAKPVPDIYRGVCDPGQ